MLTSKDGFFSGLQRVDRLVKLLVVFTTELTIATQASSKPAKELSMDRSIFWSLVRTEIWAQETSRHLPITRDEFYELFISYLGKKKRFGDVDSADRCVFLGISSCLYRR